MSDLAVAAGISACPKPAEVVLAASGEVSVRVSQPFHLSDDFVSCSFPALCIVHL